MMNVILLIAVAPFYKKKFSKFFGNFHNGKNYSTFPRFGATTFAPTRPDI
jgi:hypothetical protein